MVSPLLTALVVSLVTCVSSSSKVGSMSPNIVLIVADDLGYNDLGIRNGNKTHTPTINQLITDGVTLASYYTFRVCAPTRASIQTGRYPWGVGYYDMSDDFNHCVDPQFKMLPELLKTKGYRTHAIGKWDVGYVLRHCLPTNRGYETFLGYYTACTADYWMHGAPGAGAAKGPCNDVDFHDSVGNNIAGATMSGPDSVNGTYDQVVFTNRAVKHITEVAADQLTTDTPQPLFLYLAYHNVHDACQKDRFTSGLNAPLETVNLYDTTILDTWKVQAAMTTELDYGVGNVTAALRTTQMWENTVLIFVSDNGGPLDHSTNAPLRGGKASEWEGGYRVEAFVSSPLIPEFRRGTTYNGMMHASDWYITCFVGIANGALPDDTGPRAPDGHNLWPAMMGANLTSPRTEVIHAVQNKYFNSTGGNCVGCPKNVGVASARFGDYKIITGMNCNNLATPIVSWPTPSKDVVPFGKTTGWVRNGTNWAYAGLLKSSPQPQQQFDGQSCSYSQLEGCYTKATCITSVESAHASNYCYSSTVDPDWGTCVALNCSSWCPKVHSSAACSSIDVGAKNAEEKEKENERKGEKEPEEQERQQANTFEVVTVGGGVGVTAPDPHCLHGLNGSSSMYGRVCCLKSCGECGCPGGVPHGPGGKGCCLSDIAKSGLLCSENPAPCVLSPPQPSGCLFNVVEDTNESNNLRTDPKYADMWDSLVALLKTRADTGPPLATAYPVGEKNSTATKQSCAIANKTGFLFPLDY